MRKIARVLLADSRFFAILADMDRKRSRSFAPFFMLACALMLLVCCVVFFMRVRAIGAEKGIPTLPLYVALALGVAAAFAAAAALSRRLSSGRRIGAAAFVTLLLFGAVFSVLLPPFASPDEQAHYATAYRYANILLGKADLKEQPVEKSIGLVTYRIEFRSEDAALFDSLGTVGYSFDRFYRPVFFAPAETSGISVVRETIVYPYAVTGYIATICGLAVARLLDLPAIPALYVARFFNLALCAGLLSLAVSRAKAMRRVLLVVALFPMTLNLISSLSADAPAIALGLLAFAELTRLAAGETPLRAADLWPLALLFALLCPLKIHFAPLALSVLALGKKRFVSRRDRLLGVLLVLLPCALFCALANYSAIAGVLSGTGGYHGDGYSVAFLLSHPGEACAMIARSFVRQLPALALCMPGHLLGQLSVALPSYYFTLLYLLLVFAAVFRAGSEPELPVRTRWLFPALAALVVLACYCIMLVWWTPPGSSIIEGVQGRYFLPALPFGLALSYGRRPALPDLGASLVTLTALLDGVAVLYCYAKIIAA